MQRSWCGWRAWLIIVLAHVLGCDGAIQPNGQDATLARSDSSQRNAGSPRDAEEGGPDDSSTDVDEPPPCTLIGDWDYGQLLHLEDSVHHASLTLVEEFPDEDGQYVCGESGGTLWCDSPCVYEKVDGVRVRGYLGETLIWGGVATEDSVCFMTGGSYGMEIHRASLDSVRCELKGSVSGHGGSWDWEAIPASPDDDA